ncbi:MAG: MerC domain-containing protein [Cyclonatronaceae bacterium]
MPLFRRLSILLSSVCLAHCLAMPLVILMIPAMAHFFSETVETLIVLSILPISLVAFLPVWNRHRNYPLLKVFIASLVLILGSQFIFHNDFIIISNTPVFSTGSFVMAFFSVFIMLAGTLGLAYSLYKVNRHTHVCKNPDHHHH